MNDNTVKNYFDLFKLKNIKDGTIYYVENNQKYYAKQGHTWQEWTKGGVNGEGPAVSLYTLNQQAIAQLEPMDTSKVLSFTNEFTDWANTNGDKHFMLLCNQLRYYTVFSKDAGCHPDFGDAVCDILIDFEIYSIELQEDGAYEIWAKLSADQTEPEAFYLFPYEAGVVYYA